MADSPGCDRPPASRKAAVALLAAFLFVLPFTSSVALRNLFLALAAACAMFEAAKGLAAMPRLPPWRVLAPMFAYGAWSVASLAWSIEPAYSASELRPELLYPFAAFLAFFAVTADLATLDRWSWSLSAGLAALGLAAVGQEYFAGRWDPTRWHADVGGYATFVVLALPLLAWAFLRAGPGRRGMRLALAATAALTLLVTSWNDNRVAWVALAGMTILAIFLARDALAGPYRAKLLAATAAALIAFAALFVLSLQNRAEKLEGSARAAEAEIARDPRLAIWRYATTRIGEAPWIGHGFGRGILRQEFPSKVTPGVDNPLYTHAHNTPLNVLLQGGALGFALFAWMVAALVREMAAGLRAGPSHRLAATLGLVLVAGFAIRNQTDDFLVRHNALLAFSLAGAVLGALRRAPVPTSARRPA